MVGYIRGTDPRVSREGERPLADLAQLMTDAGACSNGQLSWKAFGTGLQVLDATAPAQVATRQFYRGGISGETHLDIVFNEIAASSDAAMVITDLWPGDPNRPTSGSVQLSAPLRRIFESGRSVAVYGFDAPFAGFISDLPAPQAPVPFVGTHPFYMIAVGSPAHLEHTRNALANSASAFIRDGLRGSGPAVHYTLFSPTPMATQPASATPFEAGRNQGLKLINVAELESGTSIQQFDLDLAEASRSALGDARRSAPATWKLPEPASALPGAAWDGSVAVSTASWLKSSASTCRVDAWVPDTALQGWRPNPGEPTRFELAGNTLFDAFQTPGLYLVTGQVSPRFESGRAYPASEWMREWSLSVPEARERASRHRDGGRFGTLFLGDFEHILMTSLAEVTTRKPRPISGFSVLVQVR
jgi:hypothetical protein